MPPKQECQFCDQYRRDGHNYCRMCGFHLTKGYVQHMRIGHMYNSNEKYCGYCGKARAECKC